jgi:hypothetical protein
VDIIAVLQESLEFCGSITFVDKVSPFLSSRGSTLNADALVHKGRLRCSTLAETPEGGLERGEPQDRSITLEIPERYCLPPDYLVRPASLPANFSGTVLLVRDVVRLTSKGRWVPRRAVVVERHVVSPLAILVLDDGGEPHRVIDCRRLVEVVITSKGTLQLNVVGERCLIIARRAPNDPPPSAVVSVLRKHSTFQFDETYVAHEEAVLDATSVVVLPKAEVERKFSIFSGGKPRHMSPWERTGPPPDAIRIEAGDLSAATEGEFVFNSSVCFVDKHSAPVCVDEDPAKRLVFEDCAPVGGVALSASRDGGDVSEAERLALDEASSRGSLFRVLLTQTSTAFHEIRHRFIVLWNEEHERVAMSSRFREPFAPMVSLRALVISEAAWRSRILIAEDAEYSVLLVETSEELCRRWIVQSCLHAIAAVAVTMNEILERETILECEKVTQLSVLAVNCFPKCIPRASEVEEASSCECGDERGNHCLLVCPRTEDNAVLSSCVEGYLSSPSNDVARPATAANGDLSTNDATNGDSCAVPGFLDEPTAFQRSAAMTGDEDAVNTVCPLAQPDMPRASAFLCPGPAHVQGEGSTAASAPAIGEDEGGQRRRIEVDSEDSYLLFRLNFEEAASRVVVESRWSDLFWRVTQRFAADERLLRHVEEEQSCRLQLVADADVEGYLLLERVEVALGELFFRDQVLRWERRARERLIELLVFVEVYRVEQLQRRSLESSWYAVVDTHARESMLLRIFYEQERSRADLAWRIFIEHSCLGFFVERVHCCHRLMYSHNDFLRRLRPIYEASGKQSHLEAYRREVSMKRYQGVFQEHERSRRVIANAEWAARESATIVFTEAGGRSAVGKEECLARCSINVEAARALRVARAQEAVAAAANSMYVDAQHLVRHMYAQFNTETDLTRTAFVLMSAYIEGREGICTDLEKASRVLEMERRAMHRAAVGRVVEVATLETLRHGATAGAVRGTRGCDRRSLEPTMKMRILHGSSLITLDVNSLECLKGIARRAKSTKDLESGADLCICYCERLKSPAALPPAALLEVLLVHADSIDPTARVRNSQFRWIAMNIFHVLRAVATEQITPRDVADRAENYAMLNE